MKKILISFLLIFTLLITTFYISNTASAACLNLNANIAIGSKDSHYSTPDVTKLQNFLVSKGLLAATPNGFFGTNTELAVKLFQKNNSLEVTGFVGPLTREKINSQSCGLNTSSGVTVPASPVAIAHSPVMAPTPTITSGSGMSIRDFVSLLVTIGVVPPERIPAVNIFLASLKLAPVAVPTTIATSTVVTATTTATTTVPVVRVSSGGGGGGGSSSQTYTVSFNANGGSGTMTSQSITKNTSANLKANSFTRTGYTFAGWATTAGGSVSYVDSASYSIGSSNVTLYAVWSANNNTLTFDSNNGSGATSTQIIATDAVANLTANSFTKEGYTFIGWATSTNGTVAYANGASYIMGSANLSLYAVWAKTYTITFDLNGGVGASTTQSIIENTSANLTTNTFTKEGYTFIGWAITTDGEVTYSDDDSYEMGTEDVTLYAVWRLTLAYNANGGSGAVSVTSFHKLNATTTVADVGSLTKTNWTFSGWNTQADGLGTDYATSSEITITDNITLYAVWKARITYDANGATGGTVPVDLNLYLSGATTTVADNVGILTNCSSFTGWNTEIDGTGTVYSTSSVLTINGNITLYAQWINGDGSEENPYKICNWTLLDYTRNHSSSYYLMTADISSQTPDYIGLGDDWQPITTFSGNFDGDDKIISDLIIDLPTTDNVGLFGVSTGNLSDVGITNISISGLSCGSLVAHQVSGSVSNSYSAGSMICYSSSGGLVGTLEGGSISKSYSSGDLSFLSSHQDSSGFGGLVGLQLGGIISNSYSSVNVTIQTGDAGGLVGFQWGERGIITNSYSTGSVSGQSRLGGLVGGSGNIVSNSYWDTETSGQATSAGGTGKTTAEMKAQATYTDWNFTDIWQIVEGVSYPTLR